VRPVTVRSATPAELDDAGRVVADAYRAGGLDSEPEYLQVVADARSRARDAEVLVAVDVAGRVLGSATYVRHGSPLAELCGAGESELRMLGVSPAAQGLGVGRLLVEECLAMCRRDSAHRMVLSTQVQARPAHRLYERLGFARVPALDWTPVPGVDLIGYARAVPAAASREGAVDPAS